MAVAAPDVRLSLVAVRQSARAAGRVATGLPERAGWVLLLIVVGLAIYVASRIPVNDPVTERLSQIPPDDEGSDAEEDAEVARARAEVSIPWDDAKRTLREAD
jgi:hypothetical protein